MLTCGRYRFSLDRPLIMGIVNVTPDSFSDGGRHGTCSAAIEHGLRLMDEGADILDIGGESSRPGADQVSLEEELSRVLPVVEALAREDIPVSVDTVKAAVMREALASGASMINDINSLQEIDTGFLADSQAAVCLMHKQGNPRTMQISPRYDDVFGDVYGFLSKRVEALIDAGISNDRLLIDPGFGFGKTCEQNLELLRRLRDFMPIGPPVLVGLSRKSMLGEITGRAVNDRVHASVAASLMAVERGAAVVRVHDVRATRDALKVFNAIEGRK